MQSCSQAQQTTAYAEENYAWLAQFDPLLFEGQPADDRDDDLSKYLFEPLLNFPDSSNTTSLSTTSDLLGAGESLDLLPAATMPSPSMYTLPLTATLGEAENVNIDVFASPGAHQTDAFLSLPSSSSNNINHNSETSFSPGLFFDSQPSTMTTSPQTIASTHSAGQPTMHADRTFIVEAGSSTSSTRQHPAARSRPSPTSSSESSDRGLPKKAARYSGNPASSGPAQPSTTTMDFADRGDRRQRNTEAARRYRQRKLDRVAELEEALAAMTKERDEARTKLTRAEAEVGILRGLMGKP